MRIQRYISYLLIVATSFWLSGCATNPVTGKKELMLMSSNQERAMGEQNDPQITQFFGVYDDKELQQFINQKGQQMAKVSHRPDLAYEFKIVDSPVVNAFAVPGGFIYFTRGIMAHFNNEAEFAGVLGHEIGHVTARHSASQYSKQMLAQVGLVAGMVISPELAQFADAAQQGIGLLFLKFGRDDEKQSDKLGVEYSTKIGYDADEMANFFNTLDRMRGDAGQSVPTFMSTHPDPADRQQKVQQLAQKWKKKTKADNLEVGRNSYLRMIDGMIYGEDPNQGYLEAGVFYHPVLKFQFPTPQGWTFQNTPQQVQMAHKEGRAIMTLSLSQGNSLEEAGQALVQNNNLSVIQSDRGNVNGLPALSILADVQPQQTQGQPQQQQQQQIRLLTYLIQYGGNIYNITGISTQQDFNQFSNTFTNTMKNFAELTDQSKINVQPERISIQEVPRTATLSQTLKSFNMANDRLEELAILNGMQLNEQVQQGMLIKTVTRDNADAFAQDK
ncbi:M48 family metalloprotease [Tunicatimonas pelagia]|uniref:M48 family metalloprotease n=1 Tax=Tunicatimonas pelagia TaxID=931531 RepID=UPI0026665B61|nr:M48 family metalloprotease [Tunicatimonas pelagia]WKN45573.1 M48 family metalloprotease [Tunicatimonas pelagia]